MFTVGQKVKSTNSSGILFEGRTRYGIVIKIKDTKNRYEPKYIIQSALATAPAARLAMPEDSLTDATRDEEFPDKGEELRIILNRLKKESTGGRRKSRKTKKARRSRRRRRNTRRN